MISWIIIPISALAYRFRGGGIIRCPDGLRKPIYCTVTGAVFGLLAWDIWAGVIVGVGSLLPAMTSPRPFFNSWNGYEATYNTKVNVLNWHQHKFAQWVTDKLKGM
jgi:hypothetical protein